MRTIFDDVIEDGILGIVRLFKAAAGSKEDAAAIQQNLSRKSALSKEFFTSPLSALRKMFPATENIDRKEAGQIAEGMTGFLHEYKEMSGQMDNVTLIRFLKIQSDFKTFAEGGECRINSVTIDDMINTLVHMNRGVPPERAEEFKQKVHEFMNREVSNSAFVHDPKYDHANRYELN